MKCAGLSTLVLIGAALSLHADEKKVAARAIDKQLFDVLKEVHNRGADIFNAGDATGCYRLFQGSLETARALLAHRPEEQKFIDDALAEAERQPNLARRAFVLHESIEKLRQRLRAAPAAELEYLTVPPRDAKTPRPEGKPAEGKPAIEPKAPAGPELLPMPKESKLEPPKEGIMGRIFWKGLPLAGTEITFVSRGNGVPVVFKAMSGADGRYVIDKILPGNYSVVLTKTSEKKSVLPERYAAAAASPLVAQIKPGEVFDFMLQ